MIGWSGVFSGAKPSLELPMAFMIFKGAQNTEEKITRTICAQNLENDRLTGRSASLRAPGPVNMAWDPHLPDPSGHFFVFRKDA